jgi:hypothetical protein
MYLSRLPVKAAIYIISAILLFNRIFGNELIRKHGSLSPMLNHKLSKRVYPENFRSTVHIIMSQKQALTNLRIRWYNPIFVNNQLDAQFFFIHVYFYSLDVSGSHVPIIRRINCINTTSGICHIWAHGCLKYVENRNKHILKRIVRQVGYLQRLYRDARSTEHKMIWST